METCDGTTHRATRNCDKAADWKMVRVDGKHRTVDWFACDRHLAQVATLLTDGQQGSFELDRIRTVES